MIKEQKKASKIANKALKKAARDMDAAAAREESLRKEFKQKEAISEAKLKSALELVERLEREKAELEEARVAASLKHSKEVERLRDSRRHEVTNERIRVVAAMTAKCATRFQNIRDREIRRGEYDDARCLHGQAFGVRRCLEGLKNTGKDIPQSVIDTFVAQEKHFKEEEARLEVGEIPESDLCLSPLVLESRFVIKEVIEKFDLRGSNFHLIDSETAKFLRTPRDEQRLLSGEPSKDLLETVEPLPRATSENVQTGRALAGEDLSVGPSKTSDNPAVLPATTIAAVPSSVVEVTDLSYVSASDREASAGCSGSQDRSKEMDLPTATFGRVSGLEGEDAHGNKDPPAPK